MRISIAIVVLLLTNASLSAQVPTIGLFKNSAQSFDGYTLFAPTAYTQSYLIDNCGRLVQEWRSDYRPTASYLMEDGALLRATVIPNAFPAGGSAGRLERLDWDSKPIWAYEYSTEKLQQHHDIEPLSNGNILIVAWEWHSKADALPNGRDSALINDGGLWSEQVVELKPLGQDSAEIV